MILTDTQLLTKLDDMFDLKKSENVTPEILFSQVNPNTIDLTISGHFKRPNKIKSPVVYGFTCEKERKIYDMTYWKDYYVKDYIVMRPGEIILGASREDLTMPSYICGQLFTKSSFGRMFINHMMAGVIDAGFHGIVTYELKNDGIHTVKIPVGARVVQMMCFGLTIAPERPYGSSSRHSRYQNARKVECAKWDGIER